MMKSCRKSDYGQAVTFIRKADYRGDFYHLMLGSQVVYLTLKYKIQTVYEYIILFKARIAVTIVTGLQAGRTTYRASNFCRGK
jgi:hypothetical protein